MLPFKFRKWWQNLYNFQQFHFCSNCFRDRRKKTFEKKRWSPVFLAEKAKMIGNVKSFFYKNFFRETVLLGTQHKASTILLKVFCWNQSFSLLKHSKKRWAKVLFSQFIFIEIFFLDTKNSFDNSAGKKTKIRYSQKISSAQSLQMIEKLISFSKIIFFAQMFIPNWRMQLWHSFWYLICWNLDFCCSKSKKRKNILSFSAKSFFLKVFFRHEKCNSDNYAELNSLNSNFFFRRKAQKDR